MSRVALAAPLLVAAGLLASAILSPAGAQTGGECAAAPDYCASKINRADAVLNDTSLNRRQRISEATAILEEPPPVATTDTTTTDTSTTSTTTTTGPPPPPGQQVMAFDLGWAPSSNIPWTDLTQLYLFNLQTTANSPALDRSNIANIDVPQWVADAHSHSVQAFISIGGSDDNNWSTSCGNANRSQFVSNLVSYATSNSFDGIDLDIEDGPWSAIGPPAPGMTACIQAVSAAAHSAGLLLAGDVITNWQGPWWAPAQASLDQLNLMTYGDNLAQLTADVQAEINDGLPASKFVVGIDTNDNGEPAGGCGPFATYAATAGLKGAFVWEAESEARHGNACLNSLAQP